MSDKLILIFISFVVFFVSAYSGSKLNKKELEKREQEQKKQWEARRKQLDDEEHALSARRQAQERDLIILKERIEEYQEKLRIAEEKLKDTQQHQDTYKLMQASSDINIIEDAKEESISSIKIRALQAELESYIKSPYKTTWQIGRDYELFVGQKYIAKGYFVDFYGIRRGFEDKGIDLIAKNNIHTLLIQCKYWKQGKVLHENVVHQLYGSATAYCREHNIPNDKIKPLLVTNVTLTEEAKDVSTFLGVKLVQRFAMEDFPRIKCCILKDEHGNIQKIYRLPFDEFYDEIMPLQPGEQFVKSVQEAEDLGFKRA